MKACSGSSVLRRWLALLPANLLACILLSGCTTLDPAELEELGLDRDAENFVTVFNAAVACESEEALAARSPSEVVQLLRRGVDGGPGWSTYSFRVPSVATEDVDAIARRLELQMVRDEWSGSKVPELRLHPRS